MGAHTLTVEIDEHTAARLAALASAREIDVAQLAAEAIDLFVLLGDRSEQAYEWSAEDLAAIQEGIAQLDRGEGIPQEQVEREINELLRS